MRLAHCSHEMDSKRRLAQRKGEAAKAQGRGEDGRAALRRRRRAPDAPGRDHPALARLARRDAGSRRRHGKAPRTDSLPGAVAVADVHAPRPRPPRSLPRAPAPRRRPRPPALVISFERQAQYGRRPRRAASKRLQNATSAWYREQSRRYCRRADQGRLWARPVERGSRESSRRLNSGSRKIVRLWELSDLRLASGSPASIRISGPHADFAERPFSKF
mmetsp:Transcript_431/g.1525  ORF Transcript_431/g.1525 Transcript_431/m.1525 type:complete len:218 (+) Transcript_431:4004-4657(+)